MPIPLCRYFLVAALVLSELQAAPARAQMLDSMGSMGAIDSVDVRVVNVEVYVTRRGVAVPDLRPEDFQIFEDGEPVPLSHFTFVSRPRGVPPSPAEPSHGTVESDGGPPPPPPRRASIADESVHVVLYFDAANIRPQNRNRLLRQMDAFVDRGLSPGDRVMVVTAGDAGLAVDLPFTEDRGALRQTLLRLRKASTQRSLDDLEQLRILAELQSADNDDTRRDAKIELEMAQNAQREKARTTLRQLRSFVTALAGLPGRKMMLYMSDGIAGTEDDTGVAIRRVTAAANANRVTFYGFDTRGWEPDVKLNPATRGGPETDLLNATLNTHIERPLRDLSVATGGFAITNHSNFDGALEKISADLTAYYSLAFSPRSSIDGQYHRIQVRVKGRGLKVRHREGYLARKTLDRLADRTLAALTFDTAENPLGVALRPTPVETAADGSRHLPILVQLPIHRLGLIPQGENYQGEVHLLVLIRSTDGRMAPAREIRLPLLLPKDEVEGETKTNVAYPLILPVIEAGFKIAVGARDAVSTLESFATLQIGG